VALFALALLVAIFCFRSSTARAASATLRQIKALPGVFGRN